MDYLKEEIAAGGLVRNLPQFSTFLEAASLSDTEQLSFATLARNVGVSAPTVKNYFEILEDTLIGNFLQAFRYHPKRRLELSPKFYFFDVGIVNHLAKRGKIQPGTERIRQDHLKGLREVITDYPKIKRRIVICIEKTRRITDDKIEILPYSDFLDELSAGKLFS